MSSDKTILENDCNPMAYASAVYAFKIFCTVYPVSMSLIHVREQISDLMRILVLTSKIKCRKAGALKVELLLIVHRLLNLFESEFNFDCKY